MPFICVICRDKLTLQKSGELQKIISTDCGHLYHQSCFDTNMKYNSNTRIIRVDANTGRPTASTTTCPTCKRALNVSHNRRVFPAEATEADDDPNAQSKLALKEENLTLKATVLNLRATVNALEAMKRNAQRPPLERVELRSDPHPTIQAMPTGSSLTIGNQIVWLGSDGEIHEGLVKWVGTINAEMFAGVEFKEAIGNNYPESGGRALFTAAPRRGRLVRIRELVLHNYFYGN